MIKNIKFENFRGFEQLALSELSPITLISGKNNAGKSSVLEGIFLAFDHVAPESFAKINQFRGLNVSTEPSSLWEPAFYHFDTKKKLRISIDFNGEESELSYIRDDSFVPPDDLSAPQDVLNQLISSAKTTYTLRFEFTHGDYREEGNFVTSSSGLFRNMITTRKNNRIEPMSFTQYINSTTRGNDAVVAEWFGKLELQGKKQQVIDILKIMDPTISDISAIAINGQIQLYAKFGERLLPLRIAGDGLNKLLFIVLAIIENPQSLILIDEIETGFHYSMYSKLWEVIAKTAEENQCQVVVSTHSYECIVGAIEGIKSAHRESDFCYYRLERNETGNYAYRYSGELLRTAISTDMEVR